MTEKTQAKLMRLIVQADGGPIMTLAQVEALTAPDVKVELFVSSRLGPDVSRETKQEHDEERRVVEQAMADLGYR